MMSRLGAFPFVFAIPALLCQADADSPAPHSRPTAGPTVASYAILARDPLTGVYGVAAASHAPLVGMNLEFLDYRVGGVVVLGGPFLQINEKALIAMEDGLAPGQAISIGLYGDEGRENRQVLALSPNGAAAFTGNALEAYAGDEVGDDYVVAGHNLAGPDVILAMEESFATSEGQPLVDRLIAALQAGRDAGGEHDGEHSAALLVVGPGARFATRDRLVDLRVDFVPNDAVAALATLRARVDSVYEVVR